ncbi:peptidase C13 [Rhodanobacter umsongensis]|uniref:Peptidase C13 n=1 Tax=Rhodanobacter umsongensis TaxID=633153 RepID=A0ABW0JKS3_9GAMM
MSIILALALLLASPSAARDDGFGARVLRGRLVEAGPTGAAYQKALWQQINDPAAAALKGCIARHAPADKSPFTVVANVLPDGKPDQVQAQPGTPVAQCFADWLATNTLPAPPALASEPAYPIEIDVSIVP